MIQLTKNIFNNLCIKSGWKVHYMPVCDLGPWNGVRLYFQGCEIDNHFLYVADADTLTLSEQIPEDISFCIFGNAIPDAFKERACAVWADCSILAFYSAIQKLMDQLHHWDQQLSDLLLGSDSLQEILECSAPLFENPCMFLNDQFTLIAFHGELTKEDNSLFYETVQLGRSPNRLFEQLLALSPQDRLKYVPKGTVVITNELSGQGEIMANCLVDGIPVLRFFMTCDLDLGPGLKDLVSHLMSRIRTSPSIQDRAKRSSGTYDILFSRLIDTPNNDSSQEIIVSLGLNRYNMFRVCAIDFDSQIIVRSGILSKLRVLCPRVHFFVYNDRSYALLGGIHKDDDLESPLEAMQRLLFPLLSELNANCGLSNDFTDLSVLGAACAQADYAMNSINQMASRSKEQGPVSYSDVMLNHMVNNFFDTFDFDTYCPPAFRAVLENTPSTSAVDNVQLLYTYLSNQCNSTYTARELHMHRNNVIYRIARLQERYSLDLDDSTQRTLLLMCCIAAKNRGDGNSIIN